MTDTNRRSNASPFHDLTEEEKGDIYARYKSGEEVSSIKRDYPTIAGMRNNTLRRYIRGWHSSSMSKKLKPNLTVEQTDVNHEIITSKKMRGRIVTLEQLLEYCEVDTDIWRVDRYIVNKWEVGRKNKEVHIRYEDGVLVEGNIDDFGTIHKDDLIQVKAWLIRHEPIPVRPTIQSVDFPLNPINVEKAKLSNLSLALVIPDIHFGFEKEHHFSNSLKPFHDRQALFVALQIARAVDLEALIFLGDLFDLADWSDKFLRSPSYIGYTQPALIEAGWWLARFAEACPQSDKYVIEGNHDLRFRDAISKHIPWAYNLQSGDMIGNMPDFSIPSLLNLDKMGYDWVGDYPNGEVWLSDHTKFVHGSVASASLGSTGAKILSTSQANTVYGHIHRHEYVTTTMASRNGRDTMYAFSPGFLGHVDGRIPGSTKYSNWQQGLAIVAWDEFNSYPELITVENGKAFWRGREWASWTEEGIVKEIRKSIGTQWGI